LRYRDFVALDSLNKLWRPIFENDSGALNATLADIQQVGRFRLFQVANWRLAPVATMSQRRYPRRDHGALRLG